MYVNESNKKSNKYGFWSRSTIPWKIECSDTHPRSILMNAAVAATTNDPLNETAVNIMSMIAFIGGAVISFVLFFLFICGKCSKSEAKSSGFKGVGGCALLVQMILFIIVTVIVFGQKEELEERLHETEEISFVNDCGDKYSKVPEYFLTDIEKAGSQGTFCIGACIAQCVLAFITCIFCVAGGSSGEGDGSDSGSYDKVPTDEDYEIGEADD